MFNVSLYTIGWVCALPKELTAARLFLDEEHDKDEYVKDGADLHNYTFGRVGKHNVVIVVMPKGGYGLTSAATAARDMIRSFPELRIAMMVGIAGGAPSKKHDIRLGDVVVSCPTSGEGGVYQYDFGKAVQEQKFHQTGHLNSPPTSICTVVSALESNIELRGHHIKGDIENILSKNVKLQHSYGRPDAITDRLYAKTFVHQNKGACEDTCAKEVGELCQHNGDCEDTCAKKIGRICLREEREAHEDDPCIHYGLVASANQVMKDATVRDALVEEKDVLCFEMEAAGLMNQFPSLVIRGICDYSDSHKNDPWQGYAAMTAAAYARLLLKELALSQVAAERPIGDILHSMEKTVDAVHQISQNIDKAVKIEAIDRWLSAPNPSENHNIALGDRHPDTGMWCLNSIQYRDWKAGVNSCLWLHGITGCGKTVLSATIIEDLQKSGYTVLYFYFDSKDKTKQSFEKMLRWLIWQMYRRNERSRSHLHQLYSLCTESDQPPCERLMKTFESMANEIEKPRIVLDALDECVTRDQLLGWLASVGTGALQVLLTSRGLDEIKCSLRDWIPTSAIMPIQPTPVNEDIRSLFRSKLFGDKEFRKRWQSVPGVYDRVEEKLMEKADGMFRWASCQIDSLRRCADLPTLNQALLSLPKDLDTTYDRILINIPDEDRRQAVRLLQFLVFANRPLALKEAVDVIAVFPERSPPFEKEHRTREPNDIARHCSSLTKIAITTTTRAKDHFNPEKTETIVELQLAHSSVKDYLVSNHIEQSFKYDFTSLRASAVIVEVSLAYLFEAIQSPFTEAVDASLPFMLLAADIWPRHARLAEEDGSAQSWIIKLFTVRSAFEYWHSFSYEQGAMIWTLSRGNRKIPDPLVYASKYGLAKSVAHLIKNGADVSRSTGSTGSALDLAARGGYEKIVEMLLPEYARLHVGARIFYLNNALREASFRGHKDIVVLLIRHGADVKAEGGIWGSALRAASFGEDEETMELLIGEGADVNAYSDKSDTALQIVSNAGNLKLVKALLDKGADTNVPGGDNIGTALYAAAVRGRKDIVEVLLEANADPNMPGKFSSALYAAVVRGDEDIVELLLHWRADANEGGFCNEILSAEGYYDDEEDPDTTPLQAAACLGYENIVVMLLANGAEVNAQGGYYGTALQDASRGGHETIVNILIKNGADVNARGGYFGTALQAASYEGHESVVSVLLDKGADIDAHGWEHGTALHAASDQGYEQDVDTISLGGKDVNAPRTRIFASLIGWSGDSHGSSPLHAASFLGHEKVVRILLDKDAKVDAREGIFGSVLQAASYAGHHEIVTMLIEKGADVNAVGGYYGKALRAALCQESVGISKSYHGRAKVVEVLLAAGATTLR